MTETHRAEDVFSPHNPLLSAYEAGRWFALNGKPVPLGATRECWRGYRSESGDDEHQIQPEDIEIGEWSDS